MQPTLANQGTSRTAAAEDVEMAAFSPRLLTSQLLASSTANKPVSGTGLVLHAQLRIDRYQRHYAALTLRLGDAAIIEARWWQFPYAPECCPREGAVYTFTGWAEAFNGTCQLRVTDAQPVPDADLSPFVPSVQRPLADLIAEYEALISKLDDPLAILVHQVLYGEAFERYCTWPAAQYKHGAVRHGLLLHSIRVASLAEAIATVFGSVALPHDRALIIAGALLHDVGKIQTLPAIAGSGLPSAGTYLDHVTLGALMVRSAAEQFDTSLAPERLEALLHIILAHHGRKEWGAPVEPLTVEAWLVHLADYAESRLWGFTEDALPLLLAPSRRSAITR